MEKLMVDVDNWTDEESARQVDALRAALGTCGTCAHIDEDNDPRPGWGFCAAPMRPSMVGIDEHDRRFPFHHRAVPLGERCTGWTAKEGA